MRAMLPAADPSRKWEVINCGGVSYASYRIAMLMEELIRYQPDLFVIYNGENEFLEHRTYEGVIATPRVVRGAGAILSRTRFYSALSAVAEKARSQKKQRTSSQTLPGEVETILDRVVGAEAYHRDDQLQKQVLDHYRFNLGRMVDIAHSVGAQVIFVTPASNLRDCAPFKNENRLGLSQAAYSKWQELAKSAVTAQNAGKWDNVLAATDAALLIDDRFAALHFLRGRALWELNRFEESKAAFVRARDEDVCPLRALTPVRTIVNEVAAHRRVLVVDFAGMMDELSDHGIPGNDWFLDHVHPAIEGNRRLALAIIDQLSKTGSLHCADNWGEATANQIKQRVESQISPKDHGIALCTAAKVLAWAGKHEEAFHLSRRALQLAPNDASVEFEVGKNAEHIGLTDQAVLHLRKAIEINSGFVEARGLLGNTLASSGQIDEAINQYQEALRLKPDYAEMHCNLATFLERRGRTNQAIAEFREAIRLAPGYAEAHCNFGWTLKETRRFDEALSEFREATRLKPGLTSATTGTAWILATHPRPQARDPVRAVKLAEQLADLSHYSTWSDLDTLAVAYASAGRYDDALRVGQKAVELARAVKSEDLSAVNERLQLYRQAKPFIEPSPENPQSR